MIYRLWMRWWHNVDPARDEAERARSMQRNRLLRNAVLLAHEGRTPGQRKLGHLVLGWYFNAWINRRRS